MANSTPRSRLEAAARIYGIQQTYRDALGTRRRASPEALKATLAGLGADPDPAAALRARMLAVWNRPVEPVSVFWDGRSPSMLLRQPAATPNQTIHTTLRLENGGWEERQFPSHSLPVCATAEIDGAAYVARRFFLAGEYPLGYHTLQVSLDTDTAETRHETLIIAAPRLNHLPENARRNWGVFVPLYALHSKDSVGAGNFTDLEGLIRWLAQLGGGVVATLPMLAGFLDRPFDPSPYSPVSRLFWSEFYVDVRRVPEFTYSTGAQALLASRAVQSEIAQLREDTLVDYARQMKLQRSLLEHLAADFFAAGPTPRRDQFEAFLTRRPAVEDYSRFRAAVEQRGTGWSTWPAAQRDGALTPADYSADVSRYHAYAQWVTTEQLQHLGKLAHEGGQGLYLDLPLGVHYDGYDVWRQRHLFNLEAAAGAPPDSFFTRGQNWGFPPMLPDADRDQGYRYTIAYLREHMRYAGVLRIDHVMSLHRLFWIPKGMEATDGVYVNYPHEELYALLLLEAHRNRTMLAGENLGTVPASVNAAMGMHHIQRLYVLQYEAQPSAEASRTAAADELAALNTHDMPPFAAWWRGVDIQDREEMGLLDQAGARAERENRERIRQTLVDRLTQGQFLAPEAADDLHAVLRGALQQLGASDARTVLVNLEDCWLETASQNTPGTSTERINWRRKTRHSLETLRELPEVLDLLRGVAGIRKTEGETS